MSLPFKRRSHCDSSFSCCRSSNLSSARSISGSGAHLGTGASTTGGAEINSSISSTTGSQTQQTSAFPNKNPPSNPSSGQKTKAIIIGVAVTGALLLVLILLAAVWWWKRRNRRSQQLPTPGISSLGSSMGGEPVLSRPQRTSLFPGRANAPAILVPYDLKPVSYTDNNDLSSTCDSVISSTEKPRITSFSTVTSRVLDSDNVAVSPTAGTPRSVCLSSNGSERQQQMQQEYEELRVRVHQMERSSDATAQNVQRMLDQIVSLSGQLHSNRHHGPSSEPPPEYGEDIPT
jgi:hypothetical protein